MLSDGAAEVRCSSAQSIQKYDLRLGRQVKKDGKEDSEWSQQDAALEEICKVEGKKKKL